MEQETKVVLQNRFKSFLWRAGAVAVVAVGTYVLKIGDFWQLDSHMMINLGGMALIALIISEVTKYLNS